MQAVRSSILSKIPVPDSEGGDSRVLPTTDLPLGKVEGASGNIGAERAFESHPHGDIESRNIQSLGCWGI
jgi:hypothetical protein